jgi:flagellar M-ring protein FliF
VHQIESNYTKRVMDILEPLVGRDNVRAQVTAEVDFSQTEQTSEEYKPNQGNSTIRSQQTSEANSGGAGSGGPSGVPGATSNQPPTPPTAPINGSAAPLQAAGGASGSGGSGKRDATTNYEVDRTVRVTRAASGMVKRLNTAVVVNHSSKTDAKGKTTTTPLSDEEVQKLTDLVKESIGFNQERGDSVKVINAPFKVEQVTPEVLPFWKQPEVMDWVRLGLAPGALTLLAVIVVFGAIRPALKAAQTVASSAAKLNAVVDDANELPGANALNGPAALPALEAPQADVRLETARQLAKDNPAAMANIVRGWVNNG